MFKDQTSEELFKQTNKKLKTKNKRKLNSPTYMAAYCEHFSLLKLYS